MIGSEDFPLTHRVGDYFGIDRRGYMSRPVDEELDNARKATEETVEEDAVDEGDGEDDEDDDEDSDDEDDADEDSDK